jgi:predicted GIY-YIG superfamily endonuclease
MIYTAELPAELKRTLSPSGRYAFEFHNTAPTGHVVYVVWDEAHRFYVGSAGDFDSRMRQHQRQLDKGTHNYLMQEAFDLAPGSFRVTVISTHANRLDAYAAEQRILDAPGEPSNPLPP